MYRRYRISNNYIPLTDKTASNKNNRLKSEMTTLGPTCRLLGFIKMGYFLPVKVVPDSPAYVQKCFIF